MLAPRWQRLSAPARALVVTAILAVLALVTAGVLTVEDASVSHGGPVPFKFRYRGLYRTTPDPGGYARVVRYRDGQLSDSFAVDPLTLPPYAGDVNGELPVYASQRVRELAARVPQFDLQGEGRTKISDGVSYQINYSARIAGQVMDAREVMLLPDTPGVRQGVVIVLLTRPNKQIDAASSPVGTTGVLQLPLQSFSFGS